TELEAAQREWEKVKDGSNPEALDLAQARLKTAKAQVQASRSALADLTLKAPFDGTVSSIHVRASEWVLPGQPVLLLADLDNLIVETTDLSEISVAQVKPGSTASITFDALPEVTVTGTVLKISPKAAEGSGVNYTATLALSNIPSKLLWGMTAFVDIQIGAE
ncbi:MAG: efflux RND transporter periplasmic adaptor subunit, partial [Anaerolineaceae bacterium]|nr:efflux RND transporter periplasmic adaptor subunit [Anaerolineaceae bacterium]